MPRLPVIGGIHTHLQVTHGIDPHVVARLTTRARAEEVHYRIHRSGSHQSHAHGDLAGAARKAANGA